MIMYDALKSIEGAKDTGKKSTYGELIAEAKKNPVTRKANVPAVIRPARLDRGPVTLNTAMALDNIHRIFGHWGRWAPAEQDLAALWTASTWFADDNGLLLFPSHPRLFFIADKGSGKTRSMKLVRSMSRNPTGIVKAPVTAPGLREALSAGRTVFLDEVDRQVGSGRGHLDVQSIISAYEADTGSLNARGGLNEQSIYGPMALAAKPRIETSTGEELEDLFERSFILRPEKSHDVIPELDETFRQATADMSAVLEIWGEAARPEPGQQLYPIHDIPGRLTARDREISMALLAVADRAVDPKIIAEGGDDLRWAIRARDAVQSILHGYGNDGDAVLDGIASLLDGLE